MLEPDLASSCLEPLGQRQRTGGVEDDGVTVAREEALIEAVAVASRPRDAAMPSRTGGASSSYSVSTVPSSAESASKAPPRFPSYAAHGSSGSMTSGVPPAKSVLPARTMALTVRSSESPSMRSTFQSAFSASR